jgi:hypothetical protein
LGHVQELQVAYTYGFCTCPKTILSFLYLTAKIINNIKKCENLKYHPSAFVDTGHLAGTDLQDSEKQFGGGSEERIRITAAFKKRNWNYLNFHLTMNSITAIFWISH